MRGWAVNAAAQLAQQTPHDMQQATTEPAWEEGGREGRARAQAAAAFRSWAPGHRHREMQWTVDGLSAPSPGSRLGSAQTPLCAVPCLAL